MLQYAWSNPVQLCKHCKELCLLVICLLYPDFVILSSVVFVLISLLYIYYKLFYCTFSQLVILVTYLLYDCLQH